MTQAVWRSKRKTKTQDIKHRVGSWQIGQYQSFFLRVYMEGRDNVPLLNERQSSGVFKDSE